MGTSRVSATPPDKKRSSGRVTIEDIARQAGVSRGAVSFALNDRPGLSVATRERILAIAKEVGWYPSSAARALQGSRVNACGLVLARPAETLAFEPFFMGLVAGIESELAFRSVALTIQVVDGLEAELEVHRRWSGERRVDGVFVVDLRVNDPRPEALVRLGLPAVVLSGSRGPTPCQPFGKTKRRSSLEPYGTSLPSGTGASPEWVVWLTSSRPPTATLRTWRRPKSSAWCR